MADDYIKRKIDQAEYHLAKIRTPENQLAVESHFAAFIAAVRSVVMYVHEWQISNGHATGPKDWKKINDWEKTLPPGDHEAWRAVVALRNMDIHEEPVVPAKTWQGGHFGGHFGGYFGNHFGDSPAQTVEHPDTGRRHKVLDLADSALRVISQLLADYKTL